MRGIQLILAVGTLVILVGTGGCASGAATSSPAEPLGSGAAAWLREPFRRALPPEARDVVDRELNVLRFNLDGDADPEYLAWVKIDHLNGLGILFDRKGGRYAPVYEIREPIDRVNFDHDSRSLIVASGHGGTGVQWNWLRVIRSVDGRFREVWWGVERSLMHGVPPFSERYGSVTISRGPGDRWVLLHSLSEALRDEEGRVLESRNRTDTYVLGADQTRFVPSGEIPAVGRHLVLDRPKTFGEGVEVLVVGLAPEDLGKVGLELVDAEGKVLATGVRQAADRFLVIPPEGLPSLPLSVLLVRPRGSGKEVLDAVTLAVRQRSEALAGVTRRGDGVEVLGLKEYATIYYRWSPDGTRLAYQRENGLWLISPDGLLIERLAPAASGDVLGRKIAGFWDGGVVYLEYRPGRVAVMHARAGREPKPVANIEDARTGTPDWQDTAILSARRLVIFAPGRLPIVVHLATGAVGAAPEGTPATSPPLDPWRMVSPDGRYVLYKERFMWDPVRVWDLETARLHVGEAVHPFPVWAPDGRFWAALAARSGEDPRGQVEAATCLLTGDAAVRTRKLCPPHTLKLVDGPWWSPEGGRVAVIAEARPARDPRGWDRVLEAWVVDVDTGRWHRAGRLPESRNPQVIGWHPRGNHLIIGAWWMPPRYGCLPVGGGRFEWLPAPDPAGVPARLDERLTVLAPAGGPDEPAAYLDLGGKRPVPVNPFLPGYTAKTSVQNRGGYAAWVELEAGARLVIRSIP